MSIRTTDTDLITLLYAMNIEPENNAMAMIDVETDDPSRRGGGDLRIFDFGYGFFNPLQGTKGEVQSNLVYEGMINPRVADQILRWDKIKNASQNHYYSLFNQLKAKNWWSDRTMTQAQIRENIKDGVIQSSLSDKYQEQTVLLADKMGILNTWMGPRFHYKEAPRRINERMEDIKSIQQTIAHLNKWMASGDNLKTLIESARITNNPSHDEIMKKIYQEFYEEQAERYDPLTRHKDMQVIREIEKRMGQNFSDKIDTWENTINNFHSAMVNNTNLLGITAYNIQHEQNAIKSMNKAFGVPSEIGDLTRDSYRLICMKNMIGFLKNQDLWDLVMGLEYFYEDAMSEGFLRSLEKAGKLQTESFQLLYPTIMKTGEKYKQPHTAKGDVEDQMDVFTEYVADFLEEFLNKQK